MGAEMTAAKSGVLIIPIRDLQRTELGRDADSARAVLMQGRRNEYRLCGSVATALHVPAPTAPARYVGRAASVGLVRGADPPIEGSVLSHSELRWEVHLNNSCRVALPEELIQTGLIVQRNDLRRFGRFGRWGGLNRNSFGLALPGWLSAMRLPVAIFVVHSPNKNLEKHCRRAKEGDTPYIRAITLRLGKSRSRSGRWSGRGWESGPCPGGLPGAFAGLVLEVVRTVDVTVTIHVVVVMGAVAVMVMVLPGGVIIVAAIAVRPTWMGTNWDS